MQQGFISNTRSAHQVWGHWVSPIVLGLFLVYGLAGMGQGEVQTAMGWNHNVWQSTSTNGNDSLFSHSSPVQGDAFADWNANYQSIREIDLVKISWDVSANSRKFLNLKGLDQHMVTGFGQLKRNLNPGVQANLSSRITQRKGWEWHPADHEQWAIMSHADIAGAAGMDFEVRPRLSSRFQIQLDRSWYADQAFPYDHRRLALESTFEWRLMGYVRGQRKFQLVNPKRTQDAGVLSARFSFAQTNYLDWRTTQWHFFFFEKEKRGSWALSDEAPLRVWYDWHARIRYDFPCQGPWDMHVSGLMDKRTDQSLGDFGMTSGGFEFGIEGENRSGAWHSNLTWKRERFEGRLAMGEGGTEALTYGWIQWDLGLEIPHARGWSWTIDSQGVGRTSNELGRTRFQRGSYVSFCVSAGVRWRMGTSRFFMK